MQGDRRDRRAGHTASARRGRPTRFVLIDALRGIAALAVVLFHVHDLVNHRAIYTVLPDWLHALLDRGDMGVQIFFVISGFVIAHSLRATTPSVATVANFIARREIRIAPLYWVVIALVLANLWLPNVLLGRNNPVPELATVVAHMFYLQTLLNQGDLLVVSWTLCLEFQFYVVFIATVAASGAIGAGAGRDARPAGTPDGGWLVVAYPMLAASLIAAFMYPEAAQAWFLRWWYLFGIGVLAYWAVEGRIWRSAYYGPLALVTSAGLWYGDEAALVGAFTSAVFFYAGRRGTLGSWLAHAPLQFLGRVSYSLYLTHFLVVSRVLNLRNHVGGDLIAADLIAVVGAIALALGAAWVSYRLVEHPSQQLSARFRRSLQGLA